MGQAKHQGSCWSVEDAWKAAEPEGRVDAQSVMLLSDPHLQMVPAKQARGKAGRIQRQALLLAKHAGLVHVSQPQRADVEQLSPRLSSQCRRKPSKLSTSKLLQAEEWNILMS